MTATDLVTKTTSGARSAAAKKIVHGLRDARASDLANCCQAVGTFIPGAVVCPVSMGRFTAGSHQLQLAGKMESI
jgi:hypothetical protein